MESRFDSGTPGDIAPDPDQRREAAVLRLLREHPDAVAFGGVALLIVCWIVGIRI